MYTFNKQYNNHNILIIICTLTFPIILINRSFPQYFHQLKYNGKTSRKDYQCRNKDMCIRCRWSFGLKRLIVNPFRTPVTTD